MPTRRQETPPLTSAAFYILLALVDRERHGYAIMQEVAAASQERIRIGPGTLYGNLKRMLASGLVAESDERPDPKLDDQRRRYYRLTPHGKRLLRAEVERLSRAVDAAKAKKVWAAK